MPDDVVARALAAGAPRPAAEALAARLPGLSPVLRAQVLRPLVPPAGLDVVRLGTAAARQGDGTTCGSAVLTMLAAAGDPTFAAWLVTGEGFAGYLAPEAAAVPAAERRAIELGDAGAAARFWAAQQAAKARTNARAVLGLTWPTALGTPPWGAEGVARFPGAAYRAARVTGQDRSGALAARVDAALAGGVPVPLYTGQDLPLLGAHGPAMPRHVVLLAGRDAGGYLVYEPSRGRLLRLSVADLGARHRSPVPAFGGWTRPAWVLLPVRG